MYASIMCLDTNSTCQYGWYRSVSFPFLIEWTLLEGYEIWSVRFWIGGSRGQYCPLYENPDTEVKTIHEFPKEPEEGIWFLTEVGMRRVCALRQVRDASPAFGIRPQLPLEDRTSFECTLMLGIDGWIWKRWMPPSQRTARIEPIPFGYEAGMAKVWYSSTVAVERAYLMCLLQADVLFAKGLEMVAHGAPHKNGTTIFCRGGLRLCQLDGAMACEQTLMHLKMIRKQRTKQSLWQ
jgi:hypothetical protein